MAVIDVLTWACTGLIAGALVGAAQPETQVRAWLLIVTAGLAAATGGGMLAVALFGTSEIAFLGSVCLAVLGTVPLGYVLQRHRAARYHG